MKILSVLDYDTFLDKSIDIATKVKDYSEIIWLRIKNYSNTAAFPIIKSVRDVAAGCQLVLSERADIADIYGYDGVHLNKNSLSSEIVRANYPNLIIGYSAHSIEETAAIDADYFTLSPIFYTKKDYNVVPLGAINVSFVNKKIYALGGINSVNCIELISNGYEGIAGISFINEIESIYSTIT